MKAHSRCRLEHCLRQSYWHSADKVREYLISIMKELLVTWKGIEMIDKIFYCLRLNDNVVSDGSCQGYQRGSA
jgi:hypothetical protein